MYAVISHQLHTVACMRRTGILSLGVVFPGLIRVVSSCMRSQPASCIAPAPAFFFLRPVSIASILYAPYHKRSLMARAFLFLNDPVQSLAHAHVGPSPILGAGPLPIFYPYPSAYSPCACWN